MIMQQQASLIGMAFSGQEPLVSGIFCIRAGRIKVLRLGLDPQEPVFTMLGLPGGVGKLPFRGDFGSCKILDTEQSTPCNLPSKVARHAKWSFQNAKQGCLRVLQLYPFQARNTCLDWFQTLDFHGS